MAESTLVESFVEDGRGLINDLVLGNVPTTAAWWAKVIPEDDRMGDREDWQFFLASPLVDEQGPKVAYEKIYEALRNSQRGDPILARISLGMIKVVGANDPIAAAVFKIIKRHGGKPPIYVARCRLGSIEAEEVHIFYVSSLSAPWQQVVLKTPAEVDEPLSPQESQAMSQIVASGINPVQAGYLVWKRHEVNRPKSLIPAGTIVSARVVGVEDDSDPLLMFSLPDGRQGITHKSNTEPVPTHG